MQFNGKSDGICIRGGCRGVREEGGSLLSQVDSDLLGDSDESRAVLQSRPRFRIELFHVETFLEGQPSFLLEDAFEEGVHQGPPLPVPPDEPALPFVVAVPAVIVFSRDGLGWNDRDLAPTAGWAADGSLGPDGCFPPPRSGLLLKGLVTRAAPVLLEAPHRDAFQGMGGRGPAVRTFQPGFSHPSGARPGAGLESDLRHGTETVHSHI